MEVTKFLVEEDIPKRLRDYHELVEKLFVLRDQGSYDDYFLQFIGMVLPFERFFTPGYEEIVEEELMYFFVEGLQKETKLYVYELGPTGLLNAMNMACYYEDVIKQERINEEVGFKLPRNTTCEVENKPNNQEAVDFSMYESDVGKIDDIVELKSHPEIGTGDVTGIGMNFSSPCKETLSVLSKGNQLVQNLCSQKLLEMPQEYNKSLNSTNLQSKDQDRFSTNELLGLEDVESSPPVPKEIPQRSSVLKSSTPKSSSLRSSFEQKENLKSNPNPNISRRHPPMDDKGLPVMVDKEAKSSTESDEEFLDAARSVLDQEVYHSPFCNITLLGDLILRSPLSSECSNRPANRMEIDAPSVVMTVANGVGRSSKIDEDSHSRQFEVYGRETMRRMFCSNVLVLGLNDLGSLVLSAYQSLVVPSLWILVHYENSLLIQFLHVHGLDVKDSRVGLDFEFVEMTIKESEPVDEIHRAAGIDEQVDVSQLFLERFKCVPAFFPPDLMEKFYHGFYKQLLLVARSITTRDSVSDTFTNCLYNVLVHLEEGFGVILPSKRSLPKPPWPYLKSSFGRTPSVTTSSRPSPKPPD